MSAVLPQSATLEGAPRGLPRWFHACTTMGSRHLVAWLLASALMSVVDFTAMIDKPGKPGVSLMMTFDLATSLILFGTTLLAWVAATNGAPISGRGRNVRVGWAIVIGAVAAACIAVPLMRALEIEKLWWEMSGKVKPQPALALVLIVGNAIHFVAWSALFVAGAEVIQRRARSALGVRVGDHHVHILRRTGARTWDLSANLREDRHARASAGRKLSGLS